MMNINSHTLKEAYKPYDLVYHYVALLNSIITWKNVLPGLKESKLKEEK